MNFSPISVSFKYEPITKRERTGQSWACCGTQAWLRSMTLLTEAPLKLRSTRFPAGKRRCGFLTLTRQGKPSSQTAMLRHDLESVQYKIPGTS